MIDESLQAKLANALKNRGGDYKPRTHHLLEGGKPKYTNRLIMETSPYLLQHAHNPVNWFAWSEEAFALAAAQDKPIFLSVGYSTCHWCHVMERESFENDEIAAYINKHFIAIKVDREERPDVDDVYMTAVNILTGRGGWPMTIVMTPDRRPFFGGTYFPPRSGVRGARQGLSEILEQLVQLYRNDRDKVVENATALSQRMKEASEWAPGSTLPSDAVIAAAFEQLKLRFDPTWGGFGGAPKFPQPSRVALLMRYARRSGNNDAKKMVEQTLHKMADGGIYDHVGGGFHRYSTDRQWLVPHFEKMLYDNSQLAIAYLEGWQLTKVDRFKNVAQEVLDYVVREMVSPEGGFYSATDADSMTPAGHEEEGWYFTWTPNELRRVLGDRDAKIADVVYGVKASGNFEGRNIFFLPETLQHAAKKLGQSETELVEALARIKPLLRAERDRRPLPGLDNKVITAWNGWMIAAMARGGHVLKEASYLRVATEAANFIFDKLRQEDGRLYRIYKDGKAKGNAFLPDYAAMVFACIELYQAGGDIVWLKRATELQGLLDKHYWDSARGGYFLTADDHEVLLVRDKPVADSAIPSGNALSALNLTRLAEYTGDEKWRKRAEKIFAFASPRLHRAPSAFPYLLTAFDAYLDVPSEVALVSPTGEPHDEILLQVLTKTFNPNGVVAVLRSDEVAEHAKTIPWLSGKAPLGGKSTAYVCERGSCKLPTSDPKVFARQLTKVYPYKSQAQDSPGSR